MAPGHTLTPAQQRVVALLSAGATATAAAQFVGVRQDLAWREQARSLAGQAVGTNPGRPGQTSRRRGTIGPPSHTQPVTPI